MQLCIIVVVTFNDNDVCIFINSLPRYIHAL